LVIESLERVEKNNFWNCEKCGEKIDDKRFFADATVIKCVKHMEI
jgi:RNA polymerase-binding transcription factor DksA